MRAITSWNTDKQGLYALFVEGDGIFLLTYGARLRAYLFMHTTHDVAKQRSEIPLDGDRRIPEEGLRAGGIAVEDEVVGELPLGTP